jgi:hypothetical protein
VPVSSEQRRPEADGHGQPRRREPLRLAGVLRGRDRVAGDRADGLPGRHQPSGVGPGPQQVAQVLAPVGDDVERAEHEPRLRRCGDPGLVLAVERDDLGGRWGWRGRLVRVAERIAGGSRRREPEHAATDREDVAARQPGGT